MLGKGEQDGVTEGCRRLGTSPGPGELRSSVSLRGDSHPHSLVMTLLYISDRQSLCAHAFPSLLGGGKLWVRGHLQKSPTVGKILINKPTCRAAGLSRSPFPVLFFRLKGQGSQGDGGSMEAERPSYFCYKIKSSREGCW